MQLSSPAFEHGSTIPERHTCSGEDLSPALHIEEVPRTAQTLALILEDPDAPHGTFVHWLIWNLSTEASDLPEGLPVGETVLGLAPAAQGKNDFGTVGYRGPCPPEGETHRYHFRLLALNGMIRLNPGSDRARLEEELEGKVVAEAELIGEFGRGRG
jgi:Raf kinase inhibitor-like YbhB/YbcL family protein